MDDSHLISESVEIVDLKALETESVIIPMNSYRGTSWYTLCLSSQVAGVSEVVRPQP